MYQVEIDVIRLKPLQLFIQDSIHLPAGVDQPAGELGGQFDLFAVAVP